MASFTSQNFFTAFRIIHGSLLTGLVLFTGVTILLLGDLQSTFHGINYDLLTFYGVGLALVFSALLGDYLVSKNMFAKNAAEPTLKAKLTGYQSSNIVKWAIIEGAALFNIVNFLIHADIIFLVLAVFMIVFLLTKRPSPKKAALHLNLSREEVEVMKRNEEIG